MQSWQTDLLNLQLSLTMKPMFKYIGSIDRLRRIIDTGDNTVGRLAIPKGTIRKPAAIPGAEFEAEWSGNLEDRILIRSIDWDKTPDGNEWGPMRAVIVAERHMGILKSRESSTSKPWWKFW